MTNASLENFIFRYGFILKPHFIPHLLQLCRHNL